MNILKRVLCLWITICCSVITSKTGEAEISPSPQTGYTIPRHLEYRFELQNTTNRVIDRAELWTYAPVPLTATQQRVNLEVSHPFEEHLDELGNSILHFTIQDLSPYATKILTIRADLLLSEVPIPLPENGESTPNPKSEISIPNSELRTPKLESYLRPEPYCESDDPDILRLAKQLSTENPVETAQNFYSWIVENITFSGYRKNPRGARYALKYKKGDCTEFMYLFVALCRAAGIPVRGLGGYVVDRNAILQAGNYHNWGEFYVDGVWYLADPQGNVFMEKQSNYIVMRVIGEVSDDHPMRHYRRFRYIGEKLKVKMRSD